MLLLQLAAQYDNPSVKLEAVLVEVIQELYSEAKEDLEAKKRRLRLVQPS